MRSLYSTSCNARILDQSSTRPLPLSQIFVEVIFAAGSTTSVCGKSAQSPAATVWVHSILVTLRRDITASP